MQIDLDTAWLLRFLLVSTRLGGVFAYSPLLGFNRIPVMVRVIAVLTLSLILAVAMPTVPAVVSSLPLLAFYVLREFLIGALIGLGVFVVFAAFEFAGQFLDAETGLNSAVLFDYNLQAQSPLLGTLFGMLGGVIVLAMGAHYALLRIIAQSFEFWPPETLGLPKLTLGFLTHDFGLVFLYGFALASPIALGVFLLDLLIAFLSRSMPQMNIYFVALPLKIFWGVLLVALALPHATTLIRALFEQALKLPGVAG